MQKSVGAVVVTAALGAWCVGDAVGQTAAVSIPALLLQCPDIAGDRCVPVVRNFVAQQRGLAQDAELVRLVSALAEVAQLPRTTTRMCLDIAEGIKVAGEAVADGEQRDAIMSIADSLCGDTLSTAAVQAGDEEEDGEGGDDEGGDDEGGDDEGGDDEGGDDEGGDDEGGVYEGGNGEALDPHSVRKSRDGSGEDPGGEDPGGEDPGGEDPGGEDPGGEDPGGEDPGGEDPGGEDPGGEDPGGEDPGGEDP